MKNNSSETEASEQELNADAQSSTGGSLPGKVRIGVSLLVIAHLMAVALPPLAFQAQGPLGRSPSVSTLLAPVRTYAQFLYLNRGYAFFAPDPGPSHLIQAAVTEPDGRITESMYPDREHQWPRLNYHRHFMLAEFLTENYQPPGPPQELIAADPRAAEQWSALRVRYEQIRQSIRDHLAYANDGKPVQIRRVEHLIPSFIDYLSDPIELSDLRLYTVLLDQSFDGTTGPPEMVPAPLESEQGSEGQLTAPVNSATDDGATGPQAEATQ